MQKKGLSDLQKDREMKNSNLFVSEEQLAWEDTGGGVRRKILGYDSALMMVRVKFQKGAIGAMHAHPNRQVTFVEKGSFEVQIGGNKKSLRAGDSFFIPPSVEHGVVAMEEGILIDVFTPAREDFLAKA
jgi:quercetin dioxygenase-like cupin family protein